MRCGGDEFLRASIEAMLREGQVSFWRDVAELRQLTEQNLKAGKGHDSLKAAVSEQAARKQIAPIQRKPSRTKLFLGSALLGAWWQSSRRR